MSALYMNQKILAAKVVSGKDIIRDYDNYFDLNE